MVSFTVLFLLLPLAGQHFEFGISSDWIQTESEYASKHDKYGCAYAVVPPSTDTDMLMRDFRTRIMAVTGTRPVNNHCLVGDNMTNWELSSRVLYNFNFDDYTTYKLMHVSTL